MTAADLNPPPKSQIGDSSPDAPEPPPPEDIDGVEEPAAEGDQAGQDGDPEPEITAPQEMAPDEFREFFCDLFNLAGTMPPLRAATIQPAELPAAHRAADSLYRMSGKYKWLRWLRSPAAFATADVAALVGFMQFKVRAVAADLQAQRAAARGGAQQPANDGAADYWSNLPRSDFDEREAA